MINIKTSIAFNKIIILLVINIAISITTRITIIMIQLHNINKINPISIHIQNNIIGLHYTTQLINNTTTTIIIVTVININKSKNNKNNKLILIKYYNRD